MTATSVNSTKSRKDESPKRSIAKALSWRIVGTLDTFILSFVIISFLGPMFGMVDEGAAGTVAQTAGYIAAAEVMTKIIIYFLHERAWNRVTWGLDEKNGNVTENYSRSVAKTATWRVLASLDTMLLAWLFTGNILTAISIGGLEVITKLILYYFHERAWLKVKFDTSQNRY